MDLKYDRSTHEILTKYEIQRLGDLAQKAEKLFDEPQELEFVIDENEIYIVQTKKIEENVLESVVVKKEEVKEKKIDKIDKISR